MRQILKPTLCAITLLSAGHSGTGHAQAELAFIESARDQACASGDAELCRLATENVATYRQIMGNSVAQAAPQPQPQYNPQGQDAVSVRTAGIFAPLPSGIGTLPQRTFWQSHCQGRPDDGSPAAQGCQQTLATLSAGGPSNAGRDRPAQIAAPAATPFTSTGRSQPSAPMLQATRVSCVSMRAEGQKGLGFWEVANACPYKVIGTFTYNNGYSGGFGPLGSGRTEAVSPPPKGVTSYTVKACIYEEWLKGICK